MMLKLRTCVAVSALSLFLGAPTVANALTDDDVKALMKKSNCLKCHHESKAKDGPSYKEIAEKNKAKPGIEEKFYKRVTTLDKVEIKGKKEDHEPLKTKDDAEIKAIVKWILTR